MKNLLILIVAIAVYLHFYPQPELESWFFNQKEALVSDFNSATDTKVKLNPEKIWQDLQRELKSFSTDEQTYVRKITLSRKAVKTFHLDYCLKKKRYFSFHPNNQAKVCAAIYRYSNML